jgi:hypothetical protein
MSDPDRENLEALRARVEAATGPDREIDAAIFDAFPDERWPRCAYREENCLTLRSYGRDPRYHDGWLTRLRANMEDKYPEDLPRLTASLDAALALVERSEFRVWTLDASIAGRWHWVLRSKGVRTFFDKDEGREVTVHDYESGVHAVPALALLSALLKSLATKDQSHG